jgi:hypothetical protein
MGKADAQRVIEHMDNLYKSILYRSKTVAEVFGIAFAITAKTYGP